MPLDLKHYQNRFRIHVPSAPNDYELVFLLAVLITCEADGTDSASTRDRDDWSRVVAARCDWNNAQHGRVAPKENELPFGD